MLTAQFINTVDSRGKGDSTWIYNQDPKNPLNLLFDGGNSDIISAHPVYSVPKFNAVFLTHFHKDHIGIIDKLLKNGQVEELYIPWIGELLYKPISKISITVCSRPAQRIKRVKYLSHVVDVFHSIIAEALCKGRNIRLHKVRPWDDIQDISFPAQSVQVFYKCLLGTSTGITPFPKKVKIDKNKALKLFNLSSKDKEKIIEFITEYETNFTNNVKAIFQFIKNKEYINGMNDQNITKIISNIDTILHERPPYKFIEEKDQKAQFLEEFLFIIQYILPEFRYLLERFEMARDSLHTLEGTFYQSLKQAVHSLEQIAAIAVPYNTIPIIEALLDIGLDDFNQFGIVASIRNLNSHEAILITGDMKVDTINKKFLPKLPIGKQNHALVKASHHGSANTNKEAELKECHRICTPQKYIIPNCSCYLKKGLGKKVWVHHLFDPKKSLPRSSVIFTCNCKDIQQHSNRNHGGTFMIKNYAINI